MNNVVIEEGEEMKKVVDFRILSLLAVFAVLFTAMPFTEKAFASGYDSYMPNPTKILTYAYYEGISTQEFSHVEDGLYIWKGIYSYGGDDPFTKYYREDEHGLVSGNFDYGYSFTHLVYPVKVGTTWSYVNYEGEKIICKITSLTKTVKTKAGTFKNVVEVKESDGRYRYYAKHIGLIKSENPSLDYGDPEYVELVSIKTNPKMIVMWGKEELKKGQIGRITVLKPINLWKRDKANRLHFVRVLKPGEQYRVYTYDHRYGGQYGLGGGYYVTKMPSYVKYETPSKRLLDKVKALYLNE
jgi:hypothetical protein